MVCMYYVNMTLKQQMVCTVCMCLYVDRCIYSRLHVYTNVYYLSWIFNWSFVFMYVCMYVRMYLFMYVCTWYRRSVDRLWNGSRNFRSWSRRGFSLDWSFGWHLRWYSSSSYYLFWPDNLVWCDMTWYVYFNEWSSWYVCMYVSMTFMHAV